MKNILLALSIAVSSFAAQAQTAIPEFKNKVMVLTKSNTLQSLEYTTLSYGLKGKYGGAGSKGYMKADGPTAGVTFNPADGNSFIVKLEPGSDPESFVTLYIFDAEKKMRKITLWVMGMGGTKDKEIPTAKLNYKKVEDGVYIMTPAQPLEEGEYIFFVNQPVNKSVSSDIKGYAFSVPAKPEAK